MTGERNVGRCCARCKTPYGCARAVCACHALFVQIQVNPPRLVLERQTAWMDPDCLAGKHAACLGSAWDHDADELTACQCDCHPVQVT